MKRLITVIAVASALGLATAAYAAQSSPEVKPADQPQPLAQPAQPMPQETLPPSAATSTPGAVPESATASSEPVVRGPNTRLAAIVPAGMSSQEACNGFKSESECAAALHAAQNLNIAFPELKSRVTGGERLATAIHGLKPGVNAKVEARKAETQAQGDIRRPRG